MKMIIIYNAMSGSVLVCYYTLGGGILKSASTVSGRGRGKVSASVWAGDALNYPRPNLNFASTDTGKDSASNTNAGGFYRVQYLTPP